MEYLDEYVADVEALVEDIELDKFLFKELTSTLTVSIDSYSTMIIVERGGSNNGVQIRNSALGYLPVAITEGGGPLDSFTSVKPSALASYEIEISDEDATVKLTPEETTNLLRFVDELGHSVRQHKEAN